MPLPNPLTYQDWSRVTEGIDQRISAAVAARIATGGMTPDDIAAGYSQLARLKASGGTEPDYEIRGTSIAYAFQYMAKRVTKILGAFSLLPTGWHPSRVLDIGSGTDATSVALSVWNPNRPVDVVRVEPSVEMRGLAKHVSCPGVRRIGKPGTLEDLIDGKLELSAQSFDLVVMSACFPYDANGWSRPKWNLVADAIWQLTHPPAHVIAIEPRPKFDALDGLRGGFVRVTNYSVDVHACDTLPDPMRSAKTLPLCCDTLDDIHSDVVASQNLTHGGLRVVGDGAFPINTWNPNLPERILIASEPRREKR